VIAVDPPYEEPADFNVPRLLGRFALSIMLFVLLSPVILLCLIFRLSTLLHLLLVAAMFGQHGFARGRHVPVVNFRIRDAGGAERQVRMKGFPRQGNVMAGDELALWGTWRHGVLFFRRGYNLRTDSWIKVRRG
jgi:hypothetical protein